MSSRAMLRNLLQSAVVAIVLILVAACSPGGEAPVEGGDAAAVEPATESNPPAPGFDLEGSDPRAIEVADATMEKMGGRRAWDGTRFVAWNFFGRRFLVWDKHNGDIRVEGTERESGEPTIALMNLTSGQGRVWIGGVEVEDETRRAELLQGAREAWINDGYWLFMPYKLKDSGVTLTHLGEQAMNDGRMADVLQLVFEGVGVTPQNKYHVYVARDSGLVEQWEFYPDRGDEEPRFSTPWHDWQTYGDILLSGNRGERTITQIGVFDDLPRSVFESPEPTGLGGVSPPEGS